MKTIKTGHIILFCLRLLIMTSSSAIAQDSIIKGRWNVKLGYSRIQTGTSGPRKVTTGHLRGEVNFGFLKFVEAGIYSGTTKFDLYVLEPSTYEIIDFHESYVPFYGINANIHLLPFLIKNHNNFRFDIYATSKIGGVSFLYPREYKSRNFHKLEYGAGLGLSFYLWDHVGFFAEHTWGDYIYRNNTEFRYGLTFKF